MEKVRELGQVDMFMKGITRMAYSMEREHTCLQMEVFIKGNILKIKKMAKENKNI